MAEETISPANDETEFVSEVQILRLDGVREYTEGSAVEVWAIENGRPVIRAYNEEHNNYTDIDMFDLMQAFYQIGSQGTYIALGQRIPKNYRPNADPAPAGEDVAHVDPIGV